jgi:hypothetical protein
VGANILEIGKMILNMALVQKLGLVVTNILENTRKTINMVKVHIFGLMVSNILESGKMIEDMDRVLKHKQMVKFFKNYGMKEFRFNKEMF